MLKRIALVTMLLAATRGRAAADPVSYCPNLQASTRLTVEKYYDAPYTSTDPMCTAGE